MPDSLLQISPQERARLLLKLAAQLKASPAELVQLFDAFMQTAAAGFTDAARRYGVAQAERGAEARVLFHQLGLLRAVLAEALPHNAATQAQLQQVQETALAAAVAAYIAEVTRALSERAARDALTKLFNRAAFDELLNKELDRAQRYHRELSLVLLDVDHFKSVNDCFGHQVGDEVLQSVAQIMQSSLRHSDLAFRHGGDEFAALCPETSRAAAAHVAQRLEQHFAQHWVERCAVTGQTLVCGLSWGVAAFPADAVEAAALVRAADEQLYICKRAHHERRLREKI